VFLYLDTSALVKRYFEEQFSNIVFSEWNEAQYIVTSSVAYAETLSCFYRKKNEFGLKEGHLKSLNDSFQTDWYSFIRVQVNDSLNPYVDRVMEGYGLRGFDGIHLASAILIWETVSRDIIFGCFDDQLNIAAEKHGLKTLNIEH
jgi:uncharacterized protein